MQPKIVFLALYDNSHGRYLLQELIRAGMSPCAVFIGSSRSTLRYRYRSIIRYFRRNGMQETVNRIIYRVFMRKDILKNPERELPPDIRTQAQQYAVPIIHFDNVNEIDTIQNLCSYKPDFFVLGGAPLLKKVVLDIPRYGVINTHPAKLPEVRGMDVVAWSIYEGVPTGLTVFIVDEGVDTGPILYFHEVQRDTDLSLEEIQQELESQAGIATVHALRGFLSGELSPIYQNNEDGKLFRAMPRSKRIKVNQLLQNKKILKTRRKITARI